MTNRARELSPLSRPALRQRDARGLHPALVQEEWRFVVEARDVDGVVMAQTENETVKRGRQDSNAVWSAGASSSSGTPGGELEARWT